MNTILGYPNEIDNKDVKIPDQNIWISIDQHTASKLIATKGVFSSQTLNSQTKQAGFIIINGHKSLLSEISQFMHDKFHQCGGFVLHNSLDEAKKYIAQVELAKQTQIEYPYIIDNPQTVHNLKREITTSNLLNTVNSLKKFHNRYYETPEGIAASKWIKEHWEDIASGRNDIDVSFYDHSQSPQPSVILTIHGTDQSDDIVIIGGHLDSTSSMIDSNQPAPGADDNASGIAVLTESLRAIVKTGYKPKKTIQIMGFAAEEIGLVGSKEIAEDYSSSKNVVGMVNFDMTGNKGSRKDIYLINDYTNDAQNQFLIKLIEKYLSNLSYGLTRCGGPCSDHAYWHVKRIPASAPFESTKSEINRNMHTRYDTEVDQDHMSNFAKLAVTYLAELAKGSTGNPSPPTLGNQLENGVVKTGINMKAKHQIFFTMDVPANRRSLIFTTKGGTGDADLYVKFGSKPTHDYYDCKSVFFNNKEECVISNVQSGVYHVMVYAFHEVSNVNLTGYFLA